MKPPAARPEGRAGAAAASPSTEPLLGKALDRHLLARIFAFVWPYKLWLAAALVVLPAAAACELAQPYLLKRAIDEHITVGRLQGLDRLGALYLAALAGQYTLLFLQTYVVQYVGQRAMADLRDKVYQHVLSLPQSFFETTPVGRLMTRMTSDIESLSEMFASGLVSLVADFVKLAFILAAIFALNAKLALISLASAPLLFGIAFVFRRIVREAFRDIRTRLANLNTFLQEHLSGVRIVQAFTRERWVAARFDELNHDYRRANARAITSDAALYAIVEAVGSFAIAALLWYGGAQIVAGTLTFGVLVAFIEYLQKFFAPIRDLSTKYTVLQQAMAAAERVFELTDIQTKDAPVPAGRPQGQRISSASGDQVVFRNVTFGYREGQPVLQRIDLAVPRGKVLAVVGPSGSGKSTLVKLLARLYEPSAGDILLDGLPLCQIPAQELRRRVVVIGQEPYLFSGTLEHAVGLGQTEPKRIAEALVRAGASELVRRRPEGLLAPVAPRGANYSAGERQLLALARALCRDPEVLVLDEATANVDPETERLIDAGTTAAMRGRTAIVIAHRLSTIANADRIVVLDEGRIVEQGSPSELLAREGLFARLHRLQTQRQRPEPDPSGQGPLLAATPTSG